MFSNEKATTQFLGNEVSFDDRERLQSMCRRLIDKNVDLEVFCNVVKDETAEASRRFSERRRAVKRKLDTEAGGEKTRKSDESDDAGNGRRNADEIRSDMLFRDFLTKVCSGERPSLDLVNSFQFQRKFLTSETKDFPTRLGKELKNNKELEREPFRRQVMVLQHHYDLTLKEKVEAFLTASEAEEFLELMLNGIAPDNIGSFLEKSTKKVSHRIFDAAITLEIPSVILSYYWKEVLKPLLMCHLITGFQSRLKSLLINSKVTSVDKFDLGLAKQFFPDRTDQVIEKEVRRIGSKAASGKQLYKSLLAEPRTRLLYIFDKIRKYFDK